MPKKFTPKIILEGTSLAFDGELAQAVNNSPEITGPAEQCYQRPLVSGMWCAFTNFPWGRGLVNFAPQEEALAMETYHVWARLFELERFYSWVVDRFHLSTQTFQLQAYGKEMDFTWLEQRLVPLGFRLVLVTRSEESARQQLARAQAQNSADPTIPESVTQVMVDQMVMERLYLKSSLLKLKVDYSDGDTSRVVGEIAGWLKQTGGLHMEG